MWDAALSRGSNRLCGGFGAPWRRLWVAVPAPRKLCREGICPGSYQTTRGWDTVPQVTPHASFVLLLPFCRESWRPEDERGKGPAPQSPSDSFSCRKSRGEFGDVPRSRSCSDRALLSWKERSNQRSHSMYESSDLSYQNDLNSLCQCLI